MRDRAQIHRQRRRTTAGEILELPAQYRRARQVDRTGQDEHQPVSALTQVHHELVILAVRFVGYDRRVTEDGCPTQLAIEADRGPGGESFDLHVVRTVVHQGETAAAVSWVRGGRAP